MFPKWSDWNIRYTTKGLVKQRVRQTLRVLALVAMIVGLYYIRKDVRGGLRALDSFVKQNVKSGLLKMLSWAEKGVRMLPEQSAFL